MPSCLKKNALHVIIITLHSGVLLDLNHGKKGTSHTAVILVPDLNKTNERIRKSTEKENKEIREEDIIKGPTRPLRCEREALEYYKDVQNHEQSEGSKYGKNANCFSAQKLRNLQ